MAPKQGSALQTLAKIILGDDTGSVRMTGASTDSGNSESTQDGSWTNPMTTLGDLMAGGPSGSPKRLGIGTSGQVLTVSAGEPAWAAPSGPAGQQYRQYLVTDDGSGGWGWVQATVGGVTRPVTALFDLE